MLNCCFFAVRVLDVSRGIFVLLKLFYPHEYAPSVFAIDYQKLFDLGYRGLLFDIDNTLVHHGDDPTPETDELLQKIGQIGLRVLILSNNDDARIQRFLRNLPQIPFVSMAGKPKKAGYRKAMQLLGIDRTEAVVIGDQIFTDIFGANRCGIAGILVRFIHPDPAAPIGKRRKAEQLVLKLWRRNERYHRLHAVYQEEGTPGHGAETKKTVL